MTLTDVQSLLYEAVARVGSQKEWAKRNSVSEQYVCDVLKGRREPGFAILDALGIEKVTVYAERAK